MLEFFADMLSYEFMVRAIIVGLLVSLCAALLGGVLVLKRYSMIGDGLSHVGFGALAVAAAFSWAPMTVAIPVVVVTAFFLLNLSRNSKLNGDSAIALLSSSALAIGMIVVSLSDINIDLNSYMFGSLLALDSGDVILSVVCSVVVIGLFVLLYHKIFAVTFDESFSSATGIKTKVYNAVIAALTAVIIVVGMRLVGALLISSLIIFPSLTSMRMCKSFLSVTICSVIVSVSCFLTGIVLCYVFPLPAGACIVAVNLFAFIVFSVTGKIARRS